MQAHDKLLEKLLSRTVRSGECLLWQGAIGKSTGYGYMWVPKWLQPVLKRKYETVPRIVYFLVTGALPTETRHTCDIRACIAPEHLVDGTHNDNVQDAVKRGRVRQGVNHRDTNFVEQDIRHIRAVLAEAERRKTGCRLPGGVVMALARRYGVHKGTIYAIYRGRSWKGLTS